ncbi:hypothetical protein JCM14635_23430 [Megalodesulfovibrio paquesii]
MPDLPRADSRGTKGTGDTGEAGGTGGTEECGSVDGMVECGQKALEAANDRRLPVHCMQANYGRKTTAEMVVVHMPATPCVTQGLEMESMTLPLIRYT